LVKSSRVSAIVFTGFNAVGLNIIHEAAFTQPKQIHVKRVVAEMRGKNAIVADSDIDLDQTIEIVAKSAFNYAGQKCSACSRVIVVESIYLAFIERLKEYIEKFNIGLSTDPNTDVGPVIDKEAYDRLLSVIEFSK
jgi:RHH-type transcriptional regulator, proline utilization regulon repressor / proline dehydrogenase / delta 1-pyrroline-5-carboxylate dehydrogenase